MSTTDRPTPQPTESWRQHFSVNAADTLAIIRWAEQLDPKQFQALLLVCFKRAPRSRRISERTVFRVLALRRQLADEVQS